MSDPSQPSPQDALPAGGTSPAKVALRLLLYSSLAVAVAVVAVAGIRAVEDQAALEAGQDRLVAHHGLIAPSKKGLAADYADDDGNLLADPPAEADELLDPDALVVAYYEGDDDDDERIDWEGFRDHLASATGKRIVTQPYLNSAEEVAAVQSGAIHVVVLHAADTPYLVNNAGFVPVAVLGSEAGASGNHLAIAVQPNSDIRKLADIRGRKLTCTRPDSITGYRAAIAVLAREAGLRPGVDYRVHYSFGQKRSIHGLVGGDFEVASLSADKLASMLADGEIEESAYRLIYESQVIPRRTIGHIHQLSPELAGQITRAALDFENSGAAADELTQQPMRFVPIDYRQDFEFARRINDSFDPRFGQSIVRLSP